MQSIVVKRYSRYGLLLLIALLFVAGGLYVWRTAPGAHPEIDYLRAHENLTFAELSSYFSQLAKQKGAVYAFNVLRSAPLPPNTDTHLLGHVVGDQLYLQKGARGISDCTQEFRNACSHTIVIGVLTDKGEAGLSEIADLCHSAPGGSGAYTMCFHGLGHGVFAYEGYDLNKTIALCRKTGTAAYRNREYIECFGGAIMELIGGGGHDHALWEKANARYLRPADPLYPCDGSIVPPELKPICYTYLTPNLFAASGDMGNPGAPEFKGAFTQCDRIPHTSPEDRSACFRGIGKELPTLAAARDIRSIDTLSSDALSQVSAWCGLSPIEEGKEECARSVVDSLFWGGENDPNAASVFCGLYGESSVRASCFNELFSAASFYYRTDTAAKARLCDLVPPDEQSMCTRMLSL